MPQRTFTRQHRAAAEVCARTCEFTPPCRVAFYIYSKAAPRATLPTPQTLRSRVEVGLR